MLQLNRWAPVMLLAIAAAAFAQEDAEGCKDYPLFSRMPGFHIAECKQSQFDQKTFPVGPAKEEGGETKGETLEGPYFYIHYVAKEGMVKPSALQIMRNFQNAARKAGGSVLAEFPGWCKSMLNSSMELGNGCTNYGTTMKFTGKGGKDVYVYVQPGSEGELYDLVILEREAMKQDLEAVDLRDKLNKDGFVALYINFETASAVIQPDSMPLIEQVVQMLKGDSSLKIEVGGHTDNTGTPEGNLKLSDARAQSVVAALVKGGVAAGRLTAKGFGQTVPVADNRTEEGRAKNRRVELVKK